MIQDHSSRHSHDSRSRARDPGLRTTATGTATTQNPGVDIDTKKKFGEAGLFGT